MDPDVIHLQLFSVLGGHASERVIPARQITYACDIKTTFSVVIVVTIGLENAPEKNLKYFLIITENRKNFTFHLVL